MSRVIGSRAPVRGGRCEGIPRALWERAVAGDAAATRVRAYVLHACPAVCGVRCASAQPSGPPSDKRGAIACVPAMRMYASGVHWACSTRPKHSTPKRAWSPSSARMLRSATLGACTGTPHKSQPPKRTAADGARSDGTRRLARCVNAACGDPQGLRAQPSGAVARRRSPHPVGQARRHFSQPCWRATRWNASRASCGE